MSETPLPAYDVRVNFSRASRRVLLVRGREAFELDAVGAKIWEECDGVNTVADLAAAVAAEFEVSQDVALADTEDFIRSLRDAGLLE